jgi:hypothetical protein
MNSLRYAACILALGLVPPAWAVYKCTDAQGKVSFQQAPCPGEGEKIEVRPAIPAPAVAPPPAKPYAEGPFGESWRRKRYLQTQGIPQARAALERNQRECAAAPAEAVAHAGPLRRGNLPQGSQFVQDLEATRAKDKAACAARSEELRKQLNALETELAGL